MVKFVKPKACNQMNGKQIRRYGDYNLGFDTRWKVDLLIKHVRTVYEFPANGFW